MTEQLKEKPVVRPTANNTVKLELCTSLAISVFFAMLTDLDTFYHCSQQYVE